MKYTNIFTKKFYKAMKYSEEIVEDIRKFIEEDGLQDYGGATKTALCQRFGIHLDTLAEWLKNPQFSEIVEKAKAVFKSKVENTLVNSLFRSATGYSTEKKHIEEWTNKDGTKRTKKVIDQTEVAPNVSAGIFLLTNVNPEKWSNRQYNQVDARVDAKVSRYNIKDLDDEQLFELADKLQDGESEKVFCPDNQGTTAGSATDTERQTDGTADF